MATSPSLKPNWSMAEELMIDFSGNKVVLTVPGNVNADYQNSLEKSVNIYDGDLTGDWVRFPAADFWWPYQRRVLLVIPDVFGSLTLAVAVFSPGHRDSHFGNEAELRAGITSLYNSAYPSAPERIPTVFTKIEVDGVSWLRYVSVDERDHESGVNYATAVSSTHFLEFSFGVIEAKERSAANWYQTAHSDIKKIIHSVKVIRKSE